MKEIPDSSIELVVTSPPYPMIAIWDPLFGRLCRDKSPSWGAMHKVLTDVWRECYRVLIDGGIMCINIGDATRSFNGDFRLYPNHAKITEWCLDKGFTSLPYLLWKKVTNRANAFLGSGFLPPNAYVTMDVEFILVFRKGSLRAFPSEDEKLRRKNSVYTKEERDKWFSQIWSIPGAEQANGDGRRLSVFPEEIAMRLIRMFSVVGDTVLDPFLGSGTTLKVAGELGRSSIGYEVDESLLDIVKQKLPLADIVIRE